MRQHMHMYIQKLQHQVLRPRLAECGQRLLPSRHGLCHRCGSRTTKTLGSYWVLAATHYSTGRRKRSTKQCRQLCAGDVSCKIFYVAFSYAPATTTWTMECYTNQNTAEIELLTDDTMLGLQEDTSAAQATRPSSSKSIALHGRKRTRSPRKGTWVGREAQHLSLASSIAARARATTRTTGAS